jgi:hypothetical protein
MRSSRSNRPIAPGNRSSSRTIRAQLVRGVATGGGAVWVSDGPAISIGELSNFALPGARALGPKHGNPGNIPYAPTALTVSPRRARSFGQLELHRLSLSRSVAGVEQALRMHPVDVSDEGRLEDVVAEQLLDAFRDQVWHDDLAVPPDRVCQLGRRAHRREDLETLGLLAPRC